LRIFKFFLIFLTLTLYAVPSHAEQPKDRMTAFLLSLAVPGLGQYYAGSNGSAKLYIAAEIAIWSGYFLNSGIKKDYRNDYLSFAARHAGVNPDGQGTYYINALSSFNSSFDYNSRQYQISSTPVLYSGSKMWQWDTDKNRDRFKLIREHELDYENYMKYCIAGAILNHFLSAINASKIVLNNGRNVSSLIINPNENGLTATYKWSY
jgi:hypothetical protein